MLKKLDSQLKINTSGGQVKIVSDLVEVDICSRIDGKNATPRIFLSKEQIAFASTNDDIENLGDIFTVRGVDVYIVGADNRSNIIYAYKITRSDKFFEVAQGYKERINTDLFE